MKEFIVAWTIAKRRKKFPCIFVSKTQIFPKRKEENRTKGNRQIKRKKTHHKHGLHNVRQTEVTSGASRVTLQTLRQMRDALFFRNARRTWHEPGRGLSSALLWFLTLKLKEYIRVTIVTVSTTVNVNVDSLKTHALSHW